LDGEVIGRDVKGLEHDFSHAFPIGLGVSGGFGEEAGVLGGSHSELVVEAVVPDFSHIVPVVDDTVFDGVAELEDTLFGLCFFPDVYVLVAHANHDVVVFGSADD